MRILIALLLSLYLSQTPAGSVEVIAESAHATVTIAGERIKVIFEADKDSPTLRKVLADISLEVDQASLKPVIRLARAIFKFRHPKIYKYGAPVRIMYVSGKVTGKYILPKVAEVANIAAPIIYGCVRRR